jgi:hypothetical protein
MVRYDLKFRLFMHILSSRMPSVPPNREQIEAQLLAELRRAETQFKQASPDQKAAAEEVFRKALREFSELVLDPKVPPRLSGRL